MMMDYFDQYLFEELKTFYAREKLTGEELEELYIRFSNLDYLDEVHPYLYAMRFLGLGTRAEPEAVMQELSRMKELGEENLMLTGLLLDLKLLSGKGNALDREKLKDAAAKGYTSVYLKEKSALHTLRTGSRR